MDKYMLFDNKEEVVFSCNDATIFSTCIGINYPLGYFVIVYDLPEWTTIVFENYKIVVNK